MAKSRGLGKGLESLIPTQASEEPAITEKINVRSLKPSNDTVTNAPVDALSPNPYQPRRAIDEASLKELAASIAEHGVIQPILVRKAGGAFQIVAGERRWRAAQLAGLVEIPIRVLNISDAQSMELALVENLQREDLNAIEIAMGLHELVTKLSLTHEQAADKIGLSRTAVTNKLRLLQLPQEVLSMIENGLITEGHARPLLSLPTHDKMREYAEMITQKNLSVRQTEELVRHAEEAERLSRALPIKEERESDFQSEIESFRRDFNINVRVSGSRKNMGIMIRGLKKWQVQMLLEYIENNRAELFPDGD